MTLKNRVWGSVDSALQFNGVSLDASAVYGQTIALGSQQTVQLGISAEALTELNTHSLDSYAAQISLAVSNPCIHIRQSWNETANPWFGQPNQPPYIITDFVEQIVVKPNSATPVNGSNIQNAVRQTYLYYVPDSGYFTSSAFIAGVAQELPPPGDGTTPPTPTDESAAKLRKWIDRPVEFQKYTDPTGTPFQAAEVTYRGVPVGLQDEDRFSPMNTPAFLPFAQETTDPYNALLLAIVALYLRSPQGRESLLRLADKYMTNVTKLLNTIIETGKTHPITALNANTTFAVVAHRFGIITDAGYLKIADQTRSIVDKLIQKEFAGIALEGLTTFTDKATSIYKASR